MCVCVRVWWGGGGWRGGNSAAANIWLKVKKKLLPGTEILNRTLLLGDA